MTNVIAYMVLVVILTGLPTGIWLNPPWRQPMNPTGTRTWDGTYTPDLAAWLGEEHHDHDGHRLIIHTEDGEAWPRPGWTLVKWDDDEITVASPHAAHRVYGPEGLAARLTTAMAAIARVHALADRWDIDAPPPGNRPLTELRATLDEPKKP